MSESLLLSSGQRRWKSRLPSLRLPRDRMELARFYIYALLVACFLLVFWMSIAPIDRVVRVQGKIIPAGRSQEIQHLEGGIIASIDVHEGQTVKKGDLLLTIKDARAGADLGETTANLTAQLAREARLKAEAAGADKVTFPDNVESSTAASGERALFESRRVHLLQEVSVHQNALQQQKARFEETSRRLGSLRDELQVAGKRVALMRNLQSRQAASQLEVLDAEGSERSLQTQFNQAQSDLPAIKAGIEEERSRIEAVQTEFRNQAQTDLVTTMADIARLQQTKLTYSDRVSRTEIHAPSDGIINHVSVNTVGNVVRPGEALMELIPNTEEVLIEARADPRDRGYLKPDLTANIRVSAYDVGELGTLKGKVTQVSADTLADPKGTTYYRVNLLVEKLPPSYQGHDLVPGMMVSADVVTGRRTMMGMLLEPIRKFTYSMFKDAR